MSGHISAELVSAIAESLGIKDLSADAASVLAPDVEYRVRDIVQVCKRWWDQTVHEGMADHGAA